MKMSRKLNIDNGLQNWQTEHQTVTNGLVNAGFRGFRAAAPVSQFLLVGYRRSFVIPPFRYSQPLTHNPTVTPPKTIYIKPNSEDNKNPLNHKADASLNKVAKPGNQLTTPQNDLSLSKNQVDTSGNEVSAPDNVHDQKEITVLHMDLKN